MAASYPKKIWPMLLNANPSHEAVARSVGYALTLGNADGFARFSEVMAFRLKPHELASITFAGLKSMDVDNAAKTIEAYVGMFAEAGMPIAPLFSHLDEAAFWADMAEPAELEAYCLASFNQMVSARQKDFLAFVQRSAAA